MILDSRRSSYYSDNENEETKLVVDADAIDNSSRKSLRLSGSSRKSLRLSISLTPPTSNSSRKSLRLSISLPPPTKREKTPSSLQFAGRNQEKDHFRPMDPGDSSMPSERVLSKGLYGRSPQHFERNSPVRFGGRKQKKIVSPKGLNNARSHFRRKIPVSWGGNSPNFGRNMADYFGQTSW